MMLIEELLVVDVEQLSPREADVFAAKILSAYDSHIVVGEHAPEVQRQYLSAIERSRSDRRPPTEREQVRQQIERAREMNDERLANTLLESLVSIDRQEEEAQQKAEQANQIFEELAAKQKEAELAERRQARDRAIAHRTSEQLSRTDVVLTFEQAQAIARREIERNEVFRGLGE